MDKTMRLNDFFEISEDKFEEIGVYNGFVFMDSPLYIHPQLLKKTKIPEFINSSALVIERFCQIVELLKKSTNYDDTFWKLAKASFSFPELKGIALGTSIFSFYGKGLTGKTALDALIKVNDLIKCGINDPELYTLLGTIQKNIGVDRISDMIANIIYSNILNYTVRIQEELALKANVEYTYKDKEYQLIKRTSMDEKKDDFILFVPKEILSEIPPFIDGKAVEDAINHNTIAKEYMFKTFFEANENNIYKDIRLSNLEDKKDAVYQTMINHPDLVMELIEKQKYEEISVYDFTLDAIGIFKPIKRMKELCHSELAKINLGNKCISLSLFQFIGEMLEKYKFLIECKGLNEELFYPDRKKLRHESVAHKLFITVLETASQYYNFDYAYEPKSGNGEVDFKFTKNHETVIAEFKLNTNDLVHGYEKQLAEYMKREKSQNAYYVILEVANNNRIENFNKKVKYTSSDIKTIIIDGKIKPSPSHL